MLRGVLRAATGLRLRTQLQVRTDLRHARVWPSRRRTSAIKCRLDSTSTIHLLDALSQIESDKVHLGLTDSNSSCLIHAHGTAHTRYVVMPMRL